MGLTAMALVASGLVALAPAAHAAAPKTAHDVPLLKSDPAPKVVPGPLVGDFTNPPPNPDQVAAGPKPRPSAYDPARSTTIDALTTPTRKVVLNSDGSRTAISSPTPVRFKDATGWHDIDLTLVPGAGGALGARSAQGGATLAAQADGIVASIDTPAGPIGLLHPSASAATAVASGAKATYKGALAGRDLIVGLTTAGFEETVMVPAASAPSTYTDEFVLPAGVSARDGAGGVEFVDAKGNVLATFSNGMAFDAAAQRAGTPVTVRVVPTAPASPSAPASSSTTSSTVAPATTTTLAPATTTTTAAPTTTTTTVAPAPANVATVEVAVDRAWMTDPARVFPISIDPTYTTVATNAADPYGIDTFAWQAAPTTNYGTATALYVGNAGGSPAEAFIMFNNLVVAPSPTTVVTESHLMLLGGSAADCSQAVDVYGIDNTLSAATVWNNRPAAVGAQVSSTTLATGCGSAWDSFDTTALARSWITGGAPNNGLRVTAHNQSLAAGFKWFYSGNTANPPLLYITYYIDSAPGSSSLVAPASGSVLATATPTLVATTTTDADGDTVKYWFRGTPATDAESGARVVDSGWITSTASGTPCGSGQICFSVPYGAITDGVTYFWHVWTGDPYQSVAPVGAPFSFRVDLGLGAKGPVPRDSEGPVSVNLASGNAVVSAASPTFSTPGGAAGLTYTYNSQAPLTMGLTGSYFDDDGSHNFPATPAMVRTDPALDFYWGLDGPGMGLKPDAFMARWTGSINAPAGTWTFAADHDDGMRVWVGGVKIIDGWNPGAVTNPSQVATSNVTFDGINAKSITVEYYQAGGSAFATLSAYQAGAPNPNPTQVPPTWFLPDPTITTPTLAPSWTLAPVGLSYTAAILGDRWVSFVDASGATHTYTSTTVGTANVAGYAPPPGEDGVVGADANGALTLSATDGIDYVFDRTGRLTATSSALDDGSPSSLGYSWSSGAKPHLTTITDKATGRAITLYYGSDSNCVPAPAAPADSPCRISYWDGSSTLLTYASTVPGSQLIRIEDPGASATDFSYTGGHLVSIRSPLTNDVVAQPGVTGRNATDADVLTALSYDSSGRVNSVTLPAPSHGAAQPSHSYLYYPTATTPYSTVSVAGLTQPLGFARKVTYGRDGAGAITVVDTDADGVATTTINDAADRLAATIDAAGRESTVTYDDDAPRAQASSRATNTYGPAPSTCFGTNNQPNGTCTGTNLPAHTATSYDIDALSSTAATGLAATFWKARTLGAPIPPNPNPPGSHTTVKPAATSPYALTPIDPVTNNFTTADPPFSGASAGNWSARYSGEINLAATGSYGFSVTLTGQARLYLDDHLVVDAWSTHNATTTVSATFANTFAGRHRFRVDYATDATAAPGLTLNWTPPGGSSAVIPTASLFPRYSMPSGSVTDDTTAGVSSRTEDAAYQRGMTTGLVTLATADRGGASQTTTATSYETGAGFMRPVTHTLGASGSTASYSYYPASPPAPPGAPTPCPNAAANQEMALETTTGATPGTGPALTHTFAYDTAGRVIGASTAGDWTCTTYDSRGRVTQVSIPAFGTEAAHTIAYNYAVGSNPLVTSVADGSAVITTTVDLLGRVASYTDAWNKTTTTTYDQPGRVTDTNGPAGTIHTDYTAAGRVSDQKLDGAVMATPSYSSTTGELSSVSYASAVNGGNGTSLSAITRSPAGATNGLTWTGPAGTLANDAVTRSQTGRVVDETIDGTDADPANPNFAYDPLGRLRQARVTEAGALHVLDYAFATSGGCGPQTAPGLDSNRTSLTDTVAGTPTVTTYCYDNADRLVSSSDPGVGTLSYDSHGNTSTLGNQTLVYDGAERHTKTIVAGGPTVTYVRDATGRIISRTEGTTTNHYGYSGPGDSAGFVMDVSNNVVERTIALVGGVTVTKRGGLLGAGDVWSYPNVHGDVMATADSTGAKQGSTLTYDPYGQSLGATPDNSAGNFDYAWLGSDQRATEHAGSIDTIEMGARQYVPSVGRFLQADPLTGGSCNDYDYACGDPINGSDLSGTTGHTPLPGRDSECLGGNEQQLTSQDCIAYRQAKVTGDSDFYYKGKTLTEPGKPNAFLTEAAHLVQTYGPTCAEGAVQGLGVAAATGAGALASAAVNCAQNISVTAVSNNIGKVPAQFLGIAYMANDVTQVITEGPERLDNVIRRVRG